MEKLKKQIRKILKIEDVGIKKYFFRIKRKIQKKMYTKKYTVDDVIKILRECNVCEGTNLCLHSCWGSFFNCTGTAEELIDAIIELIGPNATLIMPTFNDKKVKKFDVLNTPSQGGYFSEVFRKKDGVIRSIDIVSSVCAYGPNAQFLTEEHYKSKTPWDEYSPYYKFYQIGGIVLEMGLYKKMTRLTLLHCPTCILTKDIEYYKNILSKKIEYEYIDYYDNMNKKVENTKADGVKQNIKKFMKYYKGEYITKKLENVYFSAIDAKKLYDKAIVLYSERKNNI